MALLILSLLFFILLHREILVLAVGFIGRVSLVKPGPWDVRLSARNKIKLQIYTMKTAPVESISIPTFFKSNVFVSENLWNDWTNEEKESYLEWIHSVHLRSATVFRFFGPFDPLSADRDAALSASSPLAFANCIEKAAKARAQMKMSFLGSWLTGLSLIGPSIVTDWPDISYRLKRFAADLEKLHKT
ncbi:MAG: hypothetical protein J0L93_06165 [Deltaproteobacteria bacterium]|nr:hypothetical protein [Deltaproteobacteria bacterium]